MTTPKQIINFTELISAVPGEGLEELARQIGRRKGLSPSWSGRGPDGGRDIIFTEILSGPLSREKITWLVSCKDKAKSGDSVSEKDLPHPGIKDKLAQHKATGFLLVTTTVVSTGAKALLDGLDKSNGGEIHTLVWDSSELIAILLDPDNQDILKQFLPESYKRVKGLTSLEGALLAFRDQIPDEILADVMRLVSPYSESPLKGSIVWPYDFESAETIDRIVRCLIIEKDSVRATEVTEDIEFDAFIALVEILHNQYPEECYSYLVSIATNHPESDVRFNAAQFLFDNYEIIPRVRMEIAAHLDSESLGQLYSSEIVNFVEEELFSNTPEYDLYDSLDQMSSATQIDYIQILDLLIEAEDENRIDFSGNMIVETTFMFEKEKMGEHSFNGVFSGYFNEYGMYLEEASVDTSSFFEP
jgi:hypothetical protein